MARKPRKPLKPTKDSIKAAAARAEATSKGKPIQAEKKEINPRITPAAELGAKTTKSRRRRRTLYSPALGKALCTMLARGHTLTSICKRPLMPREDVVLKWAMNPTHPFSDQYARAREVGYVRMADQLVDIADDSTNDFMLKVISKDGGLAMGLNREALERTRIRLDTRKWLLSKALPKVYGDRLGLEHTGKDGGPIETTERPQATGADHLEDIARRFAVQTAPSKLNGHANGKGNGRVH